MPLRKPLTPVQTIFAHAAALAQGLGISEDDIAATALTLAASIAEPKADPDAYLARLITSRGK